MQYISIGGMRSGLLLYDAEQGMFRGFDKRNGKMGDVRVVLGIIHVV